MTDTTADDRLVVFYRSEVLEHDTGWVFFEAPCASLLPVAERHPENADRIRNQDASQFDPNGRMCLSMAGFHARGTRARMLSDEVCAGRLALVQEGATRPVMRATACTPPSKACLGGKTAWTILWHIFYRRSKIRSVQLMS